MIVDIAPKWKIKSAGRLAGRLASAKGEDEVGGGGSRAHEQLVPLSGSPA